MSDDELDTPNTIMDTTDLIDPDLAAEDHDLDQDDIDLDAEAKTTRGKTSSGTAAKNKKKEIPAEESDSDSDDIPTTDQKHLEYLRPDITRVIIIPAITTDILSEYEMPQAVITRGCQIEKTGIHYVQRPHDTIDTAEDLARAELMDRRCPLYLRRKRGEKYFYEGDKLVCEQYFEDQDPNDMMFSRAY